MITKDNSQDKKKDERSLLTGWDLEETRTN